MSPKDWFGIAVRVLGVWTVVEGLRGLVTVLAYRKDLLQSPDLSEYYLMNRVAELGAGFILMRGAHLITKFCYPELSGRPPEEPSPSLTTGGE
jgi:hypothetical protein